MEERTPLILQIQDDCLNYKVPVVQILRKAKVAAVKLQLSDFLAWINSELNGYDCEIDKLPPYRIVEGRPKAFNPVHGWKPILFEDVEFARLLSKAPIGQAIGPLEEMLSHPKGDSLYSFTYPPEIVFNISKSLGFVTDVHMELSRACGLGIIDAVRNIVLNWTLELEQSGVIGENMSFKIHEKMDATQITQHFYAQNIGFAGHASSQNRIKTIQNMDNKQLDAENVGELVKQITIHLDSLPLNSRAEIDRHVASLKQEIGNPVPNESRMRGILTSIKTVCEGCIGNLAAEGIVRIAERLLS